MGGDGGFGDIAPAAGFAGGGQAAAVAVGALELAPAQLGRLGLQVDAIAAVVGADGAEVVDAAADLAERADGFVFLVRVPDDPASIGVDRVALVVAQAQLDPLAAGGGPLGLPPAPPGCRLWSGRRHGGCPR